MKLTHKAGHWASAHGVLWLVCLIACPTQVQSAISADRIVVLLNENSPVSRAVADDYARRRGVRSVLTIRCQDSAAVTSMDEAIHISAKMRRAVDSAGYTVSPSTFFPGVLRSAETIAFATYKLAVEKPLRAFLERNPDIDVIVLTKGIPIRIKDVPTTAGKMTYALDSYLAALGYDANPTAVRVELLDRTIDLFFGAGDKPMRAPAWMNTYWNSTEPFSHAKFGGYLVTRLDGYTEADAKALVTRALLVEREFRAGRVPKGPILLDVAPERGLAAKPEQWIAEPAIAGADGRLKKEIIGESAGGHFNLDMQRAARMMRARGIAVQLDESERFVGHRPGLMGYISWGSNDANYDAAAYNSLEFLPGAISDTAVSTGARTFLRISDGGQSLIADLIAQGVSGVKGYIDEPLLQAVASPTILFERYTRGWTFAESIYAASSFVGWQDIVIGDPLLRAYPTAVRQESAER